MKRAIKIKAVITLLFAGCVNKPKLEEFNTKIKIQYVRLPEKTKGVICNEVHPTIRNTSTYKIVEATIKISHMSMRVTDSIPVSVEIKGLSSEVCGELENPSPKFEVVGEVIIN
jgi:hypothetical protein